MLSPQAHNYLLPNRKQLALSQDDVAFLIGAGSGEKVCRHERFQREPNLGDALAYEIVYRRALSELFGGKYSRIEAEVQARARELLAQEGGGTTARTAQRRRVLAEIAGLSS